MADDVDSTNLPPEQDPSDNPNLRVVNDQPSVTQALSTPDQIVPKVPDTNYPAVLGFTAPDPGIQD